MAAAMNLDQDPGLIDSTGGFRTGLTNPSIDLDFAKILPKQALTHAQLQTRLQDNCARKGIVATATQLVGTTVLTGTGRGLEARSTVDTSRTQLTFNRNNGVNFMVYLEGEFTNPGDLMLLRSSSGLPFDLNGITCVLQVRGPGGAPTPTFVLNEKFLGGTFTRFSKTLNALSSARLRRFRHWCFITTRSVKMRWEVDDELAYHTGNWVAGSISLIAGPTSKLYSLTFPEPRISDFDATVILRRMQLKWLKGVWV